MAVEKQFKCDLCGEFIRKDTLLVVRVGTLEDRPDAGERLDVGPECQDRPLQDLFAKYADLRHG